MVGGGRATDDVFVHWRHSGCLLGQYDPDVYLRQEGEDVDCAEGVYGEVLIIL